MIEKEFKEHVILLVHENNRGVCAARTTGIRRSDCKWIVLLDSDDELLPHALGFLYKAILKASPNSGRIACRYRWDDGGVSPDPFPENENLDYEGYLRWSEIAVRSDFHNCIKRDTLDVVPLPDNFAYESAYHLDFAKQYCTLMIDEVIALEHQDAFSCSGSKKMTASAKYLRHISKDNYIALSEALNAHEWGLGKFAPNKHRALSRACLLYAMLSEPRLRWLPRLYRYIKQFNLDTSIIAGVLLGMINKSILSRVQAFRSAFRSF